VLCENCVRRPKNSPSLLSSELFFIECLRKLEFFSYDSSQTTLMIPYYKGSAFFKLKALKSIFCFSCQITSSLWERCRGVHRTRLILFLCVVVFEWSVCGITSVSFVFSSSSPPFAGPEWLFLLALPGSATFATIFQYLATLLPIPSVGEEPRRVSSFSIARKPVDAFTYDRLFFTFPLVAGRRGSSLFFLRWRSRLASNNSAFREAPECEEPDASFPLDLDPWSSECFSLFSPLGSPFSFFSLISWPADGHSAFPQNDV